MTGVDLADEDARFMVYLAENGWEGEVGEDDDAREIVRHESSSQGNEKDGSLVSK